MVLGVAGTLQGVKRNPYCTWDAPTKTIIVPEDKRDSSQMQARVEKVLSDLGIVGTSVKIETFPNSVKYGSIELPRYLAPETLNQIRERLWNKGNDGISVVFKQS